MILCPADDLVFFKPILCFLDIKWGAIGVPVDQAPALTSGQQITCVDVDIGVMRIDKLFANDEVFLYILSACLMPMTTSSFVCRSMAQNLKKK
jgi:hypothetical protein